MTESGKSGMENMRERHILICGDPGVGKSTLINRIIQEDGRPVSGFRTRKLPPNSEGVCDVVLYSAEDPDRTGQVLIGRCGQTVLEVFPQGFETVGVRLIREAGKGTLLLMDELGRMEAGAPAFQRAVLEALDGTIPVIAAVKSMKGVPFLDLVREKKTADLFRLDRNNRDALTERVLEEVRNRRALREHADC